MKQNHVIMLATAILISTSIINININADASRNYHYDVNNDGVINVIDSMDLKKYLLLKGRLEQLEPSTTTTQLSLTEEECKSIVDDYLFKNCPSLWSVVTSMSVEFKTNGIVVTVNFSRAVQSSEKDFAHDAWLYSNKYINIVLDNNGNIVSVS